MKSIRGNYWGEEVPRGRKWRQEVVFFFFMGGADKWEKQKVGETAEGKGRITVADSPTGSGPG